MAVNRTAILDALYARLSDVPGIETLERRLQSFADVDPSQMPYVAMIAGNQSVEPQRGAPSKVTMFVDVYVYVHEASKEGPWRKLNEIISAVEATLERQPGETRTADARFSDPTHNTTTLGGLVSSCYIAGEIETDEGALGDVAVAIVPIALVTTT
jgi:hypothetical protein